ncbi:MAG: hypothetical protein ACRCXT_14645 [Paraclostridium sp.]
MKRTILIASILILVLFFSAYHIYQSNLTAEELIIKTFGKYDNNTKKGVKNISNIEKNKKEIIIIEYVFNNKTLEEMIQKSPDTSEENKKLLDKLGIKIMEEISKDILNKVEKLYKNNKVDKIYIAVYIKDVDNKLFNLIEFTFDRNFYNKINWKTFDKENYYKNKKI